jgi:hypothetical protein
MTDKPGLMLSLSRLGQTIARGEEYEAIVQELAASDPVVLMECMNECPTIRSVVCSLCDASALESDVDVVLTNGGTSEDGRTIIKPQFVIEHKPDCLRLRARQLVGEQ